MDRQALIDRFEREMALVARPGVDRLMEYIRKSDFYTAPASTKYHLACEGGLLQHSLNVLDAMRGLLHWRSDMRWEYRVAGTVADTIPGESVTLVALLHDLCKTYFYTTSTRNVKNEQTGQWEKQPYYSVEDSFPYGHGEKSVFLIERFVRLKPAEATAIRWHMGGFDDAARGGCFAISQAYERYPLAVKLHLADLESTYLREKGTSVTKK